MNEIFVNRRKCELIRTQLTKITIFIIFVLWKGTTAMTLLPQDLMPIEIYWFNFIKRKAKRTKRKERH